MTEHRDHNTFELGSPAVIRNSIIGRISKIDGGVFEIRTPHGSRVSAGFVWVRLARKDERSRLFWYEQDARSRGRRMSRAFEGAP